MPFDALLHTKLKLMLLEIWRPILFKNLSIFMLCYIRCLNL